MKEHSEKYSENSETVSKFEKFDFVSLWKGREKVNLLEKEILSNFLEQADGRRILEAGPGNGRLSGVIQNYASEYVTTDINQSFLKEVKSKYFRRDALYIASNLYHLPFSDNSFSTVVIVRVFDFVSKPFQVLDELLRIIVPEGYLLISVGQRPSFSTLIDDIRFHSSYDISNGSKRDSITFSNRDIVSVHPAAYPTFSYKRSFIRNLFKDAGFKVIAMISSGLEDYSLLRSLPVRFLYNSGIIFRELPIFPTTFFLLQKYTSGSSSLRAMKDLLQCPSCGSMLSNQINLREILCSTCGFSGTTKDGITDMTFIPKEAHVAGELVKRRDRP